MRILIISDVHGNWEALRSIINDEKFDLLISAGDLVDFGPQPLECVSFIRSNNTISVMGNHDWAVTNNGDPGSINEIWASICRKSGIFTRESLGHDNLEYIRNFPEQRYETISGKRFYIVHGAPSNPLGIYLKPAITDEQLEEEFKGVEASFIITGHTHFPMIRRLKNRVIINPGSVGQPKDGINYASYFILEDGCIIPKRKLYSIDMMLREYDKFDFTEPEVRQLTAILISARQPHVYSTPGVEWTRYHSKNMRGEKEYGEKGLGF